MIYFINENMLIMHVLMISLRVSVFCLFMQLGKKSTAYLPLISQLTFPFFILNDYNRLRDFYANKNCLNKFFKFNILDDLYIH